MSGFTRTCPRNTCVIRRATSVLQVWILSGSLNRPRFDVASFRVGTYDVMLMKIDPAL